MATAAELVDWKAARDAVLQDILLEAIVLGVKVDVYEREDTYVSPFDKEKAE